MDNKKESCSSIGLLEQDIKTIERSSTIESDGNYSTIFQADKYRISSLLSYGRDRAMSSTVLMNLLGIESLRDLRRAIEEERKYIPILSCAKGYCLAERDEYGFLTDSGYQDTKGFYQFKMRTAKSIAKSAVTAYQDMELYQQRQQMKLKEFEDG